MRYYLTEKAAKAIYNSMIVPVLTYSSLANLKITNTQKNKLLSLQSRASKIIKFDATDSVVPSINNLRNRHACTFTRKCLSGDICENFQSYFRVQNHQINTRNNKCMLILPKMRTEFAKRSAEYMCSKIYNELPLDVRKEENFNKFKFLVKHHFR